MDLPAFFYFWVIVSSRPSLNIWRLNNFCAQMVEVLLCIICLANGYEDNGKLLPRFLWLSPMGVCFNVRFHGRVGMGATTYLREKRRPGRLMLYHTACFGLWLWFSGRVLSICKALGLSWAQEKQTEKCFLTWREGLKNTQSEFDTGIVGLYITNIKKFFF